MSQETNVLIRGRKPYTAIIAYRDDCCERAHIAIETILAESSRDALQVAKRRCRRNGILAKTGEIQIVRGTFSITTICTPREAPKYVEDEVTYTSEETLTKWPTTF